MGRPMKGRNQDENLTEEENADRNTRRGFLVVVVIVVGLAILLSTTCGDTDIERKELQHKLTWCKAKLSSKGKDLNEKDSLIKVMEANYQVLLETIKPLLEQSINCGEVKMQLGKLKGIVEEQDRTALSNIMRHDEADKRKEMKIDGLVGNVSSLLVELAKCQKKNENVNEKIVGCDNDLQECKNNLKKCWI
uniref:Uncharacterized protein n=1 Tax=Amphimedon queenslandica TaxID=400682 RepID=A0A1X7VGY2_AMPQE